MTTPLSTTRSYRAPAKGLFPRWLLASLSIAIAVLFSGCNNMELQQFADRSPALKLETYFVGDVEAWGIFVDRFGNVRREFKVDIQGSFDGQTLELVEHFVFADGEKDVRIWNITPLPDGRYEGSAEDVIGVAKGTVLGNALHWEYDVDMTIGGRSWQVHFNDWMFQQDDRTLINRATVSKFGFTLGEVIIFFRRV